MLGGSRGRGWVQEPVQERISQGAPRVTWKLEGLRREFLTRQVTVSQPDENATTTSADVLEHWTQAGGGSGAPSVATIQSTALALYAFTGPAGRYLSWFGQVAGGLPVERCDGALGIASPTGVPAGGYFSLSSLDYVVSEVEVVNGVDQLRNVIALDTTDLLADQVLTTDVIQIEFDEAQTTVGAHERGDLYVRLAGDHRRDLFQWKDRA